MIPPRCAAESCKDILFSECVDPWMKASSFEGTSEESAPEWSSKIQRRVLYCIVSVAYVFSRYTTIHHTTAGRDNETLQPGNSIAHQVPTPADPAHTPPHPFHKAAIPHRAPRPLMVSENLPTLPLPTSFVRLSKPQQLNSNSGEPINQEISANF
jgi:hypothetical protein